MNYGPQNVRPSSDPRNNPFNQGPRHAVSQPRSWNVKPSRFVQFKRYLRNNVGVIVTAFVTAGAIVAVILLLVQFLSGNTTAITTVNQPATASQVAAQLGCTNFKDTGPAKGGGSIDTGYCFIGTQKYAINTFASKAVRDSWLKLAEPLGVNPKWETDTSVTYKSVSITA